MISYQGLKDGYRFLRCPTCEKYSSVPQPGSINAKFKIEAQIYHRRRVLHNWQHVEARKILQNIADAMAPDSKLLIGEMVVPKKPGGVNKYVYMMDICMLAIGGKELKRD